MGARGQVPCGLQLEPMRLATGNAVQLAAGASLPETAVAAVNGAGQRMVRGTLGGERAAFTVVQRLWRLEGAPAGRVLWCPLGSLQGQRRGGESGVCW